MSIKDITPEMAQIAKIISGAMPGATFHFTPVFVCDHCKDQDREAFPYYVTDKDGNEWAHLCNPCFDVLDCRFDDDDGETLP